MQSTPKIDALADLLHEKVKNSGEALTPLERFNAVHVHNTAPDRLLAWAFYREYPRYLVNYTVKELETDHLKECESILAGLVEFGYDTVWTNVDVYSIIPEIFGCKIDMLEDAVSVPASSILNNPEDLDKLKPIDPYKDGRLSVVLNTVALLREKIGDIYPILGHCSGPISLASTLRGGSKFVIDLKKRPEFVTRLLDFCADQLIIFSKALLDLGAVGVQMADAAGSPSMLSPQKYDEFFLPTYMKIQKALGHLTPPGVRWHSQSGFETLDNLKDFLEKSLLAGNNMIHVSTPWSLGLDMETIQELCRKYGGILWFGIEPASFTNLTPEQLDLQVKEYIEKYATGFEGHFQIGPNMLNDTSKPELVKAYMDAIKKYGKCPVGK